VVATASIVAAYAGSLIFRTMQQFVARAFFSYKNTRTLAYVSVAFIVLNAVLDYVLMHLIGAPGIALGTTIDGFLYFIISLYMLERMLLGRHAISVRPYLWALVAALPLAPLGLAISGLSFVHGRLHELLVVVVGSLVLLAIYLSLLRLLGGTRAGEALRLLGRVARAPGRRIAAMRR
jgi:peptidoglycan biosynthesis protein MviN/MurJ (putative lipid II flippase)